ncbi:hypothetical protein [Paenibacillus luteus]|uniref:hypothetical protein n=1 Tax=Paenibacillus luteus TaxID=2545753 RepID=UPI0013754E84|nr:hypothetical protein [Paenibacillus luteus]
MPGEDMGPPGDTQDEGFTFFGGTVRTEWTDWGSGHKTNNEAAQSKFIDSGEQWT